jgi:hypothetical protein
LVSHCPTAFSIAIALRGAANVLASAGRGADEGHQSRGRGAGGVSAHGGAVDCREAEAAPQGPRGAHRARGNGAADPRPWPSGGRPRPAASSSRPVPASAAAPHVRPVDHRSAQDDREGPHAALASGPAGPTPCRSAPGDAPQRFHERGWAKRSRTNTSSRKRMVMSRYLVSHTDRYLFLRSPVTIRLRLVHRGVG